MIRQNEIYKHEITGDKIIIKGIFGDGAYDVIDLQGYNRHRFELFMFKTWIKVRSPITLGAIIKNPLGYIFEVYSMNLETQKYQLKVLKENKAHRVGMVFDATQQQIDKCEDSDFVPEIKSRDSKNQYFLKIAKLVSSRSTCPRRSVGCVIVNQHDHIKATGYNGVPKNFPHCIEKPCGGENNSTGQNQNSCMATHAEQNALLQCGNTMEIEKIYLTVSPCVTCAKLIGNTSCKQVIYAEEYIDKSGVEMLTKLGIETIYEPIK